MRTRPALEACRRVRARDRVRVVHASAAGGDFDLNHAITALNAAVEREDYAEAARLKKVIGDAAPSADKAWDAAVPEWLRQRLERLAYRFPTPVQAATLRAAASGRDVVVRAPTGSGKTLGYLSLLLALAAPELGSRGEATVAFVADRPDLSPSNAFNWLAPALATLGAGAAAGAAAGALPARGPPLALVVAPRATLAEQVAGVAYALVGGYARAARTWNPGARDSLFSFTGPKGCRVVLAADPRLILSAGAGDAGGAGAGDGFEPSALDLATELASCDVLVATPEALAALAERGLLGEPTLRQLRAIAVDEGDEGLTPAVLRVIVQSPAAAVRVCVGATVSDALVSGAVGSDALRSPILANGKGESLEWGVGWGPVMGGNAGEMGVSLPPSLRHRFALIEGDDALSSTREEGDGGRLAESADSTREGGDGGAKPAAGAVGARRLFVLAQLMRDEVALWERTLERARGARADASGGADAGRDADCDNDADAVSVSDDNGRRRPRPRCVVFTKDESAVLAVARSLRTALWGCHAVACLLPSTGEAPSLIASSFRRAQGSDGGFEEVTRSKSASVLVAPASAARGLDFANVSSVYALDVPPAVAEYVHIAGRAGRVGQEVQGVVTCVLASRREVDELRALVEGALGRELVECGPAGLGSAGLDRSSSEPE